MSSEYVLRNFVPYLTNYEQTEICNYKHVWYLGKITTNKIMCNTQNPQLFNFGFDTEEGVYRTILNDHLAYRYQILAAIGNGFSGEVLKCYDYKTKQFVAIKVFRNKDSVLKLAKSEMKVLKALQESDKNSSANIVHMKEHFYFRNHLCITFDLFDGDLYRVMKRKEKHRVTEDELKGYTVDILKCLQLLRKKNIVHGDLKPENILVRKKNDERQSAVTDFGGSFYTTERDKPLVFTLSYMSPELLLGKRCRTATDMWSLGCIIAELHLSQRLFKGPDTHSIFSSIMEVLGIPPEELLADSPQRKQFFGNPRRMETKQKLRTSVATKLKSKDVYFINFIESCLEYDPKKRMTPDKALRHPWIGKNFEPKTISRLIKDYGLAKPPPPQSRINAVYTAMCGSISQWPSLSCVYTGHHTERQPLSTNHHHHHHHHHRSSYLRGGPAFSFFPFGLLFLAWMAITAGERSESRRGER
ncbi:dual specificity tyrosine-phosphorylation-regulated kinase 4-like [Limanda limanda]|uniref:dual specificity tyrosine-phosphorylation-regulated kinase 4-like n=1 Tax=Limanda limanda TaxID=27771 RepID=UPI0029C99CB8|nr:dual specificity tyrosine-phosphorylation-regulated kinase 4-like [Limanda limanda]